MALKGLKLTKIQQRCLSVQKVFIDQENLSNLSLLPSSLPSFRVKYCQRADKKLKLAPTISSLTNCKAHYEIRTLMSFLLLALLWLGLVLPASAEESLKLNLTKNVGLVHQQSLLQDVMVPSPVSTPDTKWEQPTKSETKKDHLFATIPVFYATTRLPDSDKELSYSKERGSKLDYGVCEVSRPFSEDEQRSSDYLSNLGWQIGDTLPHHCVGNPKRFESAEEMFSAIKQVQSKSGDKRLIVFIHGYAASFNKAAKIGAHLAYGSGVPVLIFSWPTQHNFLIYTADECNAEWTYPRFQKFLSMLNANFSAEDISLISHSMGARIVSWALQNTPDDQASDNAKNHRRYQHIFFCCPDIDKDTFAAYADRIERASKDTVVFVSGNDVRLGFSELLHGHARLGEFTNHPKKQISIPGIETVDFTALDSTFGHSMPYPLIFKALNPDLLAPSVRFVQNTDDAPASEVVKIAGKR
jgi:esterase/lipase superfamily enzyme